MIWFMRKSANSTALLERARELGVRPPSYSIPAAQAEVQISDELRQAASKIVDKLEDDKSATSEETVAEPDGQPEVSSGSTLEFAAVSDERRGGSGRSKADPKVIHLHI
jgi:hypothetical protein